MSDMRNTKSTKEMNKNILNVQPQALDVSMVIYKITNIINNKIYIDK